MLTRLLQRHAVVANEIRQLAEQSASSTTMIDNIVRELQINSQDSVQTMEKVFAITNEQTKSVQNAASTHEASASMVEQSASIDEIAGASEGLADLAVGLQSSVDKFKI